MPLPVDGIVSIKRQIIAIEEVMKQIWLQLVEGVQGNVDMTTLALQYAREASERDKFVGGLIMLYEEIKKMGNQRTNVFSIEQKRVLEQEVHFLNLNKQTTKL